MDLVAAAFASRQTDNRTGASGGNDRGNADQRGLSSVPGNESNIAARIEWLVRKLKIPSGEAGTAVKADIPLR